MDQLLAVGMQRLQQCGGEASGRAKPSAGRNVGHGGDFQRAAFEADQLKRFADDRMLEVIDIVDTLERRVFHDQVVDESLVNGDVNVLIDCRGNQKAGLVAIV